MKNAARFLILIACPLLVSACAADSSPTGPSSLSSGIFAEAQAGGDPTGHDGRLSAHALHPGAPTAVPFDAMIPFGNPCTGLPDAVTVTGMLWIHDAADVVRSESTLVTASGFEGQRRRTIVEKDGKIFKVSLNGMMVNASGDRIRLHFILLIDLATGTTRVQQGGGPVCVGA